VANLRQLARRTAVIAVPFFTGIAVALTLFACCCPRGVTRMPEPAAAPPLQAAPDVAPPADAIPSTGHVQTEMRNVLFRIDPAVDLRIHTLRGEMFDKTEGRPLDFDDKRSFTVRLFRARIGIAGADLTALMNRYIFGYPGSPLKNLVIHVHEGRMVQEGVMHKIVDIPFEMTADVSATEQGMLRIHPLDMKICNVDGTGLMKAFGITLGSILKKLPDGVHVEKNDIVIDALRLLPPPAIEGHLAGVELHEDELVQIFESGTAAPELSPLDPHEPNTMIFRGGTLRMGKLFMVKADMQVLDTDRHDPFDFWIDYYNRQLTEGFTRNQPNYGLKVYMRDFADVGKPAQAGERLAPE